MGDLVSIFYSVYVQNKNSYVEIQVKDTGCGIKKADKKKLFKLFGFIQTTQEANTRGIGLGLSISKKIVEAFNGKIDFDSHWGKGSTFVFRMQLENEISVKKPNEYKVLLNQPVEEPALPNNDVAPLVKNESVHDPDDNQIQTDRDLQDLVFGNHLLPSNVLSHLPPIGYSNPQPLEQEICDTEVNDGIEQAQSGNLEAYLQIQSKQDHEIKSTRLLIVDDEPYNLDALKIIL